jgi:hypothetical protein
MGRETVIVSDPEILGGTPCFRATRVPVDSLIDYLGAGDTPEEFRTSWPGVVERRPGRLGRGVRQPVQAEPECVESGQPPDGPASPPQPPPEPIGMGLE